MLDLKCAIRQLLKSPGFTAVAVLTLALCIGANLTIFAVVDAIVVRSLPFPEPDRLVVVENAYPGAGVERGGTSVANYFERRGNIEAFESLSIVKLGSAFIVRDGSDRRVRTAEVTPEFFQTLGVPLAIGQTFTDAEWKSGSDWSSDSSVAVITDRFWRDYFDADPNVLGRTFDIWSWGPRKTATVVGVLPPGFRYLSSRAEIYRPHVHDAWSHDPNRRHENWGHMVARLAVNRSITGAEAELAVHNEKVATDDPSARSAKDNGFHTWVASLHEDHVRSVKPVLLLLQAGVLCLLLIGAVNLAGLLLIRASGRTKELAVRKALGASRRRITGQILTETLLISLAGGALGILLAVFGIRLLKLLGSDALPMATEITFDERIAFTAILVSIAVGVCIAVPTIWLNLRGKTSVQLQSESREGTVSRGIQRLRHAFIVSQIAIAFVLLCGAGMLSVTLKDISPIIFLCFVFDWYVC